MKTQSKLQCSCERRSANMSRGGGVEAEEFSMGAGV